MERRPRPDEGGGPESSADGLIPPADSARAGLYARAAAPRQALPPTPAAAPNKSPPGNAEPKYQTSPPTPRRRPVPLPRAAPRTNALRAALTPPSWRKGRYGRRQPGQPTQTLHPVRRTPRSPQKTPRLRILPERRNSVSFGVKPGEQPRLIIGRRPNGLFAAHKAHCIEDNHIRIIQRGKTSLFHQAWRFITAEAALAIENAAASFLKTSEDSQRLQHGLPDRLCRQEAEIAAGISQHTGAGPDINAIGNAALRNLLGPDNFKNAVRCAGYNATLEHLNQTII